MCRGKLAMSTYGLDSAIRDQHGAIFDRRCAYRYKEAGSV
jgi:hypothetical protein